MKNTRTLLVDGDIVAYKAAVIAETPIDWGNGVWTLHAHEKDVIASMEDFMAKIIEESGCDEVITCLSGDKLYRKDVAPYYKANRKGTRKPMLLNFAKKYLSDNYNGKVEDKLEADDLLGILGSADKNTVIWSIDKDLLTIPAYHLLDGKVTEVDQEEADYWFLYQTLIGDSTDNYKGCPAVGAKTADKLLQEKGATWQTVVDAFADKGFGEEVAIENARLARILRDGEYDFKTKEVSLWMQ
jgi:DNA polymerase-1